MSLDEEVRNALHDTADRHESTAPDVDALMRGGEARRRHRQNRGLVAVVAAVAVVIAGAGVAMGLTGDDSPADRGDGRPSPRVVPASTVPWCVPDLDDPEGEGLIVGAGAPIKTWCRTGAPDGSARLWHHASRTVLVRSNGVYLVADGRLAWLHVASYGNIRFSHDGRYAAWLVRRHADCRGLELAVYDLATTTPVARAVVPAAECSTVHGIDDLGRVYVTVEAPGADVPDVRMYDVWAGRWQHVADLPPGTGDITYVTDRGFAAQRAEHVVGGAEGYRDSLPVASFEGVVDALGRFGQLRPVPIGPGLWSPDRSLVADQQPVGVVVRPSEDLSQGVLLDLPTGRFRITARHVPHTNLQWESPDSLLVSALVPTGPPSYRCNVRTGDCTLLDRNGDMALGNSARPGG